MTGALPLREWVTVLRVKRPDSQSDASLADQTFSVVRLENAEAPVAVKVLTTDLVMLPKVSNLFCVRTLLSGFPDNV